MRTWGKRICYFTAQHSKRFKVKLSISAILGHIFPILMFGEFWPSLQSVRTFNVLSYFPLTSFCQNDSVFHYPWYPKIKEIWWKASVFKAIPRTRDFSLLISFGILAPAPLLLQQPLNPLPFFPLSQFFSVPGLPHTLPPSCSFKPHSAFCLFVFI